MAMDRTLTLFPNLPIERLKIWRSALALFPGILEAKPHKPWSNTTPRARTPKWSITPTTINQLLSVNRESRNELKINYATPFSPHNVFPAQGSTLDFRLHARGCPYMEPYPEINALHFNYGIDTLFLDITDLYHLWPRIYTFSELIESVFGNSLSEAQRELRSLAGSEDLWDTIIYEKNNDEKSILENFVSMEKSIVLSSKVFSTRITD
ncbi:hypothetical protein N431DRAFT_522152 [Stipitochalara longipes BDJ]|nr:hypothetical protein N431DRAFT_522152 [Stipitochalara longipes BDJ]